MPDGTVDKQGKVFKGWYFYWMKEKRGKKKIFFMGDQLDDLVRKLNATKQAEFKVIGSYGIIAYKRSYNPESAGSEVPPPLPNNVITDILLDMNIKFIDKGNTGVTAYNQYTEYRFPEYVRMPLAQCATCFASIYGSLFYWIGMLVIDVKPFGWSSSPVIAMIFYWIVFCMSLAVINTALAKKYN